MAPPPGALLWPRLRAYQIYGANTDVGKTVFSTVLCAAANRLWGDERVSFFKPVSTGQLSDADYGHVKRYGLGVGTHSLYQYGHPISPDRAAVLSGQYVPSDDLLLGEIRQHFGTCAENPGWLFLETAGGVHSPGPSGTSQADLYRPLRLPVILIGDSRLGGISQTISAFESLRLRGYDVEAVMLFRDYKYKNHGHLGTYFRKLGIPCKTLPKPPPRKEPLMQEKPIVQLRGAAWLQYQEYREKEQFNEDGRLMHEYYKKTTNSPIVELMLTHLAKRHKERIERLGSMSSRAHDCIWYPFTQQKLLSPHKITTIDSASGDHFQTLRQRPEDVDDLVTPVIEPSFDGSASWWTQGLGHGNPQLTLAAAYAAGRYGHVMFAEAIHEPALSLAELLLKGLNNPRLSRVFYSDNGSTGTEVAVKMGLRAARLRYGWNASDELGILGLKGSYHGDTIGAMDCSEPCTFNEEVEWYEGKGFWFDYPTVMMTQDHWIVGVPESLQEGLGPSKAFASLKDVFDVEAREKGLEYQRYEQFITSTLEKLQQQGQKFGALMLEPVILGAGGMRLVDPLFQRALVQVVRRSPHLFGTSTSPAPTDDKTWTGLPVIFDEVFTGLYRLGRFTSSSFLGVHPDISVHAKLLTGGLVPLCTTLASDSIFKAFESDEKSAALLHGHSYTAHAVGCQVAIESVTEMQRLEMEGAWDWCKQSWVAGEWEPAYKYKIPEERTLMLEKKRAETAERMAEGDEASEELEEEMLKEMAHYEEKREAARQRSIENEVWSFWPLSLITSISKYDEVEGVFALGSVMAIHFRDADGAGYNSSAARDMQARLADNVHSRVLGNVLYLMASLTMKESTRRDVLSHVKKALRGSSKEEEEVGEVEGDWMADWKKILPFNQ